MARLLVTGGAGFIGANFAQYWVRQHPGERIVIFDALTYAGHLVSLKPIATRPELRFIRADICDTAALESVLREEAIDTIVHFAAESHVDRSIVGPDSFVTTNIVGTHSLLKAARRVWLEERRVAEHRFHHVSTDEVYGSLGPHDAAFTETTPYAPNSPYAASKAASDHLVRAYHHTYGLSVTISNCSNNYGPYQSPEKLIPLMMVNILTGQPLPVYGDGRNVRDWLHVGDHCRAIDLVLRRGTPGAVYNIGGRSECENLALVKRLCAIADARFAADAELRRRFAASPAARGEPSESLIRFVTDRPGHDRRYAIDTNKVEKELGFTAEMTLDGGLPSTFDWYLDNEAWWREVMDTRHRQWISTHYASSITHPA
ncbi:MAG TPA: dTDP-glucose 4,6-dehydratase [Steroidobacteraceae bacterium]|nr:dTDP-glucose 4,6-dehydratase [Steroidobacteraceae bacterium]